MNALGAVFMVAVCWALGSLLFRTLGIRLKQFERDLLAGTVGASLLSTLIFLLCSLSLAQTPVFLLLGISAIALAAKWAQRPKPFDTPLPFSLKLIFGLSLAFYATLYLSNSLAPEHSPDGATYHLGVVARYFREHGFVRITTNFYANLSQGLEMLFLFAYAFGRHSAAATVHCCFLIALPFLMLSYGRRIGRPWAGATAGLLFYLSPLAGIDGVSAYNDVALATVAFALYYLLEIWREDSDDRLVLPIGLLAGFCFAIKYTGFVAPLYAGVVLLTARHRLANLARAAAATASVALPWVIKNWILVGNPVPPFFNSIFKNPFVHISFETFYRDYFRSYGLPSFAPLFRMVTVTGELGGQLGPVFLLAPLALLALRFRAGRHCLLAALFFLLPYPGNLGARFLLFPLPFLALGIALALEFSQAAQILLITAALVLAWPRVIDKYRAPAGGWQIAGMPWQVALGIHEREAWLRSRSSEYELALKINSAVPPNKRLWSSIPVAEAYTIPDILVYYYSGEGELLQDILLTPISEGMQPRRMLRLTFPRATYNRLRLLQQRTAPEPWSITEIQFFNGAKEVPATALTPDPFPWDARLAGDRNPVTRWCSWQPMRHGMHVDATFASARPIDRIDVQYPPNQGQMVATLEGIQTKSETLDLPSPGDLRRVATAAIREREVEYLLIGGQFPASEDMRQNPSAWGLRPIAEQNKDRIYQIQ